MLVIYLIYATISQLMHIHGKPMNILIASGFGIFTLAIAFSSPKTVTIRADGLEQISWLWKNRRIRLADIVEINAGKESRTVTITGADGTKIVHSPSYQTSRAC